MKPLRYITTWIMLFGGLLLTNSCGKDFLDRPALGALSSEVLATPAGINSLLIGAYAALDGQSMNSSQPWSASVTNWIFGSVAGGEAHKGSDATDQAPINPIATFDANPSNVFFNDKWIVTYEGITRCNSVLRVLPNVEGLSEAQVANIAGQARFLRGHYYFELKKMFNNVPWIDETTKDVKQPNNVDIWPKIEADFQFAMDNLPEEQAEAGRANKWAAACYLAKSYVFEHKFPEAKTLYDNILTNGKTSTGIKYGLLPQFEQNFQPQYELTSPESVFAVEMSANVGTGTIAQAANGDMLNFPYGDSPFGCCGFYQPTQDLVNSYRTDASGLPYLDDYNDHAVKNDMAILSSDPFTPDAGNLDPRLDWTVGRRGIPYLDWGIHPGYSWIRSQPYAGPYSPKKNVYWQNTNDQYHDASSWAPGSAINYYVMRYAGVLLMAAEAYAQTGDLDKAEDLVNKVRERAADPAGFVYKYNDPDAPLDGFSTTTAAAYKISKYPAGKFTAEGKDYALKAIYFERKLELAMEGKRFFDLVRWGIAQTTMNAFFAYEGGITIDVQGGHFTAPRNKYYPIPLSQIDLSKVNGEATLTQNEGYQ